jgi:YfiH family protein
VFKGANLLFLWLKHYNKMRWIFAPAITAVHGFSTRHGGVSPAPFASLNLGGKEDDPENIAQNRKLALNELNIDVDRVSYLDQVHGTTVCKAQPGKQTGDALVTNEKGLPIAVGAADCYPVLFHDDKNRVIGAAHCGWKGTLGKIVKNTIEEMLKLGAEMSHIKVAIGQGICRENYEVSEDVIAQFREAGFPGYCWSGRQLDLLAANRFVALESGIAAEQIWSMNRCTTEPDFFSYRRDQGKTGRMWAVIMLK